MTAFTVWKFEGPEGAAHAAPVLKGCERDGLVKILDHAIVSWPKGGFAARPPSKRTKRRGAGPGGELSGESSSVPSSSSP